MGILFDLGLVVAIIILYRKLEAYRSQLEAQSRAVAWMVNHLNGGQQAQPSESQTANPATTTQSLPQQNVPQPIHQQQVMPSSSQAAVVQSIPQQPAPQTPAAQAMTAKSSPTPHWAAPPPIAQGVPRQSPLTQTPQPHGQTTAPNQVMEPRRYAPENFIGPMPLSRSEKLMAAMKENWTGLLGAGITVLGIGFFGTMAGTQVGPEGRFGLILAVAAIFFAASVWIQRRKKWQIFATWFSGIAGSVTLFAMLGAGGIDGLKFIGSQGTAQAFVAVGILVNLVLAWRTPHQAAGSFHVVVSLLALGVAPASIQTLIAGGIVILFGTVLSYRKVWDLNLLTVIIASCFFQFYWRFVTLLDLSDFRWIGIGITAACGLGAAAVHYRKEYESSKFETLPFAVHLLNWLLFGVNMVSYSSGSKTTPIILGLAAIGAFICSRVARAKKVSWLVTTDNLVAQFLGILSITMLNRFGLHWTERLALAYLAIFFFCFLNIQVKEKLLTKIGLNAVLGFQFLLLFLVPAGVEDPAQVQKQCLLLTLCSLVTWVFAVLAKYKDYDVDLGWDVNKQNPLLVFVPFFPIVASMFFLHQPLTLFGASLLLPLMVASRRLLPESCVSFLNISYSFASIVYYGWIGFVLLVAQRYDFGTAQWMTLIPLVSLWVSLSLNSIWQMNNLSAYRITHYMFFGYLAAIVYATLVETSDFLPGTLAAMISALCLELALLLQKSSQNIQESNPNQASLRRRQSIYVFHGGVFFLCLFIARHLLVHIQSEVALFGWVTLRAAIECLGLLTLLFWISEARKLVFPTKKTSTHQAWTLGLLRESIFLFVALTVMIEVGATNRSIVWALIALGLSQMATVKEYRHLKVHGFVFYVISCINLAAVTSIYETGSGHWYSMGEVTGVATIALLFGYTVLTFKRELFEPIDYIGYLKGPTKLLTKYGIPFLLYPLALSIAIYLYWRFSHAILTLLWVVEVFIVFVLGIYLRTRQFVHVALVALGICIVRLMFFDLANTGLAVRAGVFVGVGILMLAINFVYKKYRDRIS